MAFVITIQSYNFLFKPTFTENIKVEYLKRGDQQLNQINLLNFMPAFAIVTEDDSSGTITYDYNNDEYWTYTFVQASRDEEGQKLDPVYVPAKDCVSVIKSFTNRKEGKKQSMIDELPIPDYLLCPDTDTMKIQGESITEALFSFQLRVAATHKAISEGIPDKSEVVTA